MHRGIAMGLAVAFALILAASAAAADFPEQPGDLPTACAAVVSQGQGIAHHSATADAIVNALYQDACLGG